MEQRNESVATGDLPVFASSNEPAAYPDISDIPVVNYTRASDPQSEQYDNYSTYDMQTLTNRTFIPNNRASAHAAGGSSNVHLNGRTSSTGILSHAGSPKRILQRIASRASFSRRSVMLQARSKSKWFSRTHSSTVMPYEAQTTMMNKQLGLVTPTYGTSITRRLAFGPWEDTAKSSRINRYYMLLLNVCLIAISFLVAFAIYVFWMSEKDLDEKLKVVYGWENHTKMSHY